MLYEKSLQSKHRRFCVSQNTRTFARCSPGRIQAVRCERLSNRLQHLRLQFFGYHGFALATRAAHFGQENESRSAYTAFPSGYYRCGRHVPLLQQPQKRNCEPGLRYPPPLMLAPTATARRSRLEILCPISQTWHFRTSARFSEKRP